MITGQEKPDDGTIEIGETVKLGYVDQAATRSMTRRPSGRRSPAASTCIAVGNREIPTRAYVSSFNFKGGDQQKKVGQLSGGERNRVHLAKTLLTGGNVILLDEPTNDLDVETLQSARRGAGRFRRLRRRHQPRPLVPGPPGHPHPGLRGRQPRRMVRRQLRQLRRRQEAPPRRRQPHPAPDQVPEVRAVARWRYRNG